MFISGPTKSQGTAPVGVAAGGKDDFEISEEDLAAWANTMMDDREKTGEEFLSMVSVIKRQCCQVAVPQNP